MAVDFPAPLAPRKPNISPLLHCETDVVDGTERTEGLDQMLHLDNVFARCLVSVGSLNGRRIEDVPELFECLVGCVDSLYLTLRG